jgi:hypothetical protein
VLNRRGILAASLELNRLRGQLISVLAMDLLEVADSRLYKNIVTPSVSRPVE